MLQNIIESEDNLDATWLSQEVVKRDLVQGSQIQKLQLLYRCIYQIVLQIYHQKQPSKTTVNILNGSWN